MAKTRRLNQELANNLVPGPTDDYEPLPGEIASNGGPVLEAPYAPPDADSAAEAPASKLRRMAVISDRQAGVRFHFDYQLHRGEITFDDKPTPEVRAFLKENGFNWDRDAHVWAVPIRFQQREQDRLAAKRAFHKCAEMIRAEKGIEDASPPLPE